jgi:hypothetical protein
MHENGGDPMGELLGDETVFLVESRRVEGAAEREGSEAAFALADGNGEQGVEAERADAAEVG